MGLALPFFFLFFSDGGLFLQTVVVKNWIRFDMGFLMW